jgi:pimeloyl-ACP methyl ester carboxylesterase
MEVKVNDVTLYCEQYGIGKPLVLSYGWLDDCSIWHHQVGPFSKDHTVIIYDHRGHGRSEKPRKDYSVTTLANDLYALMESLKLEDTALIGFSLGGVAALICALTHLEKVTKLVLIGTTAKFPPIMHFFNALWRLLPYDSVIRYVSKGKYYEPTQNVVAENIARAVTVPKYAAYECLEQFTKHYDIENLVSQIKIPTLIITGDKDRINLKASHFLNKKIVTSKLEVFPACGHTVMIEEPERFNETVLRFIDEKP